MENIQNDIIKLLQEATGQRDVLSIDYKAVDDTTKDKIDFTKVRGSVRLMSGKIKTSADVDAMRKRFLALQIP